jgi:hypothetical protein
MHDHQDAPARGARNAPVFEIRRGAICGSVWKNHGNTGPWYSVRVQRMYKDGDAWKYATTFGRDDCLVAAEVLRACWHEVSGMEQADRAARPRDGAQYPAIDPAGY